MCGIAGIIADADLVRAALPRMVAALSHRGPDDRGCEMGPFGDRFLGLGHTRLAILDLSPAGRQPMLHPESGSLLVFNGEIYNFARLRASLDPPAGGWRSSGDTEVLLHALERWGPDCLPRLQGMYAFAWRTVDRLLLARDPLGIKPLYLAEVPGAFLFASEVNALLASGLVPRRLDRRGLAGVLAYGAVQHPYTLIQSVASFAPGHWRWLGPGIKETAPRPFFSFPEPRQDMDRQEAVTALRETVKHAVEDHLVSDVPVGVFLSSGLDSTVVAALAGAAQLRSFTVGFTGHPDLSETRLAAQTARAFGLNHTEILVAPQEAARITRDWLGRVDQPSVDGLNVYLISEVVRAAGIKVALSGQGGDELFGGYPSFSEVPWLLRLRRRLSWLPPSWRRLLLKVASLGRDRATREKLNDMAASPARLVDLYFHRRRAASDRQMALLGLEPRTLGLTDSYQAPETLADLPENADAVWLVSQLETRFYQGNMLLRDGDAASMAHGLELRVPLLDQRLVELAFSLPGRVRLPSGAADKDLLRQAFGEVLRPDLLSQAKRGFSLPLPRWLLGELRPLAEHSLCVLKQAGVLAVRGVEEIWTCFLREPRSPVWSRAFALVVLGAYLERNGLV